MVPGAHVFLVSVAPFTAVRLCVFALSAVHGWRGGGGANWVVGQLAARPAVNGEVGVSSRPAPAGHRSRSSDACHRISLRRACTAGAGSLSSERRGGQRLRQRPMHATPCAGRDVVPGGSHLARGDCTHAILAVGQVSLGTRRPSDRKNTRLNSSHL